MAATTSVGLDDEAPRGVPDSWQFSPRGLCGHRDRVGLSRTELGATIGVSHTAIKQWEYGLHPPRMKIFLRLCDSLGISPNDLCRQGPDDGAEYDRARNWSPPPPMMLMRRS